MKILTSAALAAALLVSTASAQDSGIATGREIYLRECAPCHGQAGTGYGPGSWVLIQRPPDLTRLSNRTTPFPREPLANVIKGRIRAVPSHGWTEMPKWRKLDQLDALLAYLESIQMRPFGPYQAPTAADVIAAGATLFSKHCAVCHGSDGRGTPVSGLVVGLARPDLTTLAARHGAFEFARVVESIAHCSDDSDMPSWQTAFGLAGYPPAVTQANLEAVARFLESIQAK